MSSSRKLEKNTAVRAAISLVAILLFVLSTPLEIPLKLESPQIVLVLIGLSPWLTEFIDSITFGGSTIKTRVLVNEQNIHYIIQLMRFVLTKNQLDILRQLDTGESMRVTVPRDGVYDAYYDGFKADALRLRGLDLLQNRTLADRDGKGFSELEKDAPVERIANTYFEITQKGREFLRTLEKLEAT